MEQSISTLSIFSQLMTEIPVKNDTLMKENWELRQENTLLKKQVQELERGLEEDPREEQMLTQ